MDPFLAHFCRTLYSLPAMDLVSLDKWYHNGQDYSTWGALWQSKKYYQAYFWYEVGLEAMDTIYAIHGGKLVY